MIYPVSPRFLQSLPSSREARTTVQLLTAWGDVIDLDLVAGSRTSQGGQGIRRTANLTIAGPDRLYGQLSSPGALIDIRSGLAWDGTQEELVPQIYGELSSAVRELGSGAFAVTVADLWQRIAVTPYVDPVTPDPAARRVDVITAAVQDAIPGTRVVNRSTDDGLITSTATWEDRASLIQTLATDGGNEAYFDADGSFVIRNSPSITDPAVYVLKAGDGGTITTLSRTRPLDRLYNTVIVVPSSLDGSQTWTQVVAQIEDATHPRHPSRIGVRPYKWSSPSILTEDEAAEVAQILLDKVLGTTESLALGTIAHPALEPGDVLRILNPTDDGFEIITHFEDSDTLDLVSHEQSVATRSQTELAA